MIDLQLRNITKTIEATNILEKFSLSVKKGELCCLLGPSGCGKTTILNLIAGFLIADSGSIELADQKIDPLPPRQRDVGMVFQKYALFPHLTVFENIAYGLKRQKSPKSIISKKVTDILALVKLSDFGNRQIHELSGGQQQRIALARALVLQPKLLILDEPLSNLDAGLRVYMRNEIRQIQQELGLTTLYVTHDQEEAMSIADQLAVMNHGIIQQVDTPQMIYRKPANTFVAEFIGKINWLKIKDPAQQITVLGQTVDLPERFHKRNELQCGIRPESIKLCTENSTGSCSGTITNKSYLGSITHYQISTAHSEQLMVEGITGEYDFKIGDLVGLTYKEQDLLFF